MVMKNVYIRQRSR